MGIHGIYKEIGPGQRIALSKLSAEHYVQHSRPFRLAIDVSIWLFQIQSGKGGSNPALRTFYYRLLRLLSLNIHPLFVFDGPNKPLFKRHKRVGGPGVKVSSIPEFLAKQLLKQFGFPWHVAPGEAEAECALLQREDMVDGVLSEDVDTLMFGSGLTLRSWTPEMKSSKVPTHVNVYEAAKTKDCSGLDREGMILIALMSGGDYIPEGIPGCGPKTACDAARAGFGADLCKIRKKDDVALKAWRERLQHELHTNESKLFKQKRKALLIPDDFPNPEVLGYYTHPCVSGPEKLARLRDSLNWDMPLDFASLRTFAADAFDWRCLGGAKKFVRNLAPALLVRELRLRAERAATEEQSIASQEAEEGHLISAIHGKRTHATTDNALELRVSFVPLNVVDIDLSIEEPDEELAQNENGSDDGMPVQELGDAESECPASPSKRRGPSTYDPAIHEKIWIMDTFLRIGVPLKVQDWEASFRDPKQYLAAKQAAKEASKANKPKRQTKKNVEETQRGALDRFAKVTKPGIRSRLESSKLPEFDEVDLSRVTDLANAPRQTIPSTAPLLPRSTLVEVDLSTFDAPRRQAKRRSPDPTSPDRSVISRLLPPRKAVKQQIVIDLLSSPVAAPPQRTRIPSPPDLRHAFRRCGNPGLEEQSLSLETLLPDTVTKRRKKSPFKRVQSAPTTGEDPPFPTPLPSRPSTPPPIDIVDAMDLASPALPSASELLGLPARIPSRAMIAAEIKSPYACPPRNIDEWIRRSQSVTPSRVRYADSLVPTQAVSGDPSSSMPTPPMEDIDEVDASEEVEPLGVSAFLPFAKRLRDRPAIPALKVGAEASKSRVECRQPDSGHTTRQSPRLDHRTGTTRGKGLLKASTAQRAKKYFIQPRDSLEGAWKEVEAEHVNLTGEALPSKAASRWRKSAIEVLDLTGS